MIAKLSGVLAHKTPGEIVVDAGGVGYQVLVSLGVFYRLPEVGKPVSLFIHTHLREDALQLFGFLDMEEKHLFLLLNGVAGIGPKLAITILSGIPTGELASALRGADQVKLLSIPGVGKKLAERMVVELRDKLPAYAAGADGQARVPELMQDAVSALVNLGYRQSEAEKAVRQVTQVTQVTQGEPKPLTEVLKEALHRLSQ
jgi:Holliday junction DNA helicase RuvA